MKIDSHIGGNWQILSWRICAWIVIYEQRDKELQTDRSSFCNILGPNISSYFKRQPVAVTQHSKINKQFVRKNK